MNDDELTRDQTSPGFRMILHSLDGIGAQIATLTSRVDGLGDKFLPRSEAADWRAGCNEKHDSAFVRLTALELARDVERERVDGRVDKVEERRRSDRWQGLSLLLGVVGAVSAVLMFVIVHWK